MGFGFASAITMAKFTFVKALVIFVGMSSTHAQDLNEVWLKRNESISASHIENVLAIFREDQMSLEILEALASKLKVAKLEDVFQLVKVADKFADDEGARTVPGLVLREFYFLNRSMSADLEEVKRNYFAYKITDHTYYKMLTAISLPEIYVKQGVPLWEIYANLVHEFSHAVVALEIPDEESVLDYVDINDYVLKKLNARGNEFAAYTTHIAAWIRLKSRHDILIKNYNEKFFSATGELIDPVGLQNYILDEAIPSFSYRKFYEMNYRILSSKNVSELGLLIMDFKNTIEQYKFEERSTTAIEEKLAALSRRHAAIKVIYDKFHQ